MSRWVSQLPYVEVEPWVWLRAGSLNGLIPTDIGLQPFGVLMSLGIALSGFLAVRRGLRLGMSRPALVNFILWVLVGGAAFAHVFDVLCYQPERLCSDPLLLLRFWDGLSVFGGFLGGVAASLLWSRRQQSPVLPYVDTVASGVPLGMLFGRGGCALSHDHPGRLNAGPLSMPFPDGQRLDMGLLEMLALIPLTGLFWFWLRERRPWGFFPAAFCTLYAPLRFGLDFYRDSVGPLADVRYAGLTPAQWLCLPMFVFGLLWWIRAISRRERADAFAVPRVPARLRP